MKSNHHLIVYAIVLIADIAIWILLVRVTRLIKASKLYARLRTFWQLHVNAPVCEIHGEWNTSDIKDGFCGRCLDDHSEGRGPANLHEGDEEEAPTCTQV